MASVNRVLDIARGEIGYSRWDDPEQGTKYGRWYARLTGEPYYGANGVPYCAMFVSWVFDQAGQSAPGLPGAYCPWIVSAGKNAGQTVPIRQAQPGDIVLFDWGGDGVSDHVGIVEANNGSYLTTIEGNTSDGNNSNGGMVQRRTRAYSTVICMIRPTYTGDDDDMPSVEDIWGYDNAGGKLTAINQGVDAIRTALDTALSKLTASVPIVPLGGAFTRYANNDTGAHIYTNSPAMGHDLINRGWINEGVKLTLGTSGEPVYELINPNNDDCIVTTDVNEAETLARGDWQSLGIVGTVGDGPEVHRLYNGQLHLYTTDTNEVSTLVGHGWQDEGVKFRAV